MVSGDAACGQLAVRQTHHDGRLSESKNTHFMMATKRRREIVPERKGHRGKGKRPYVISEVRLP